MAINPDELRVQLEEEQQRAVTAAPTPEPEAKPSKPSVATTVGQTQVQAKPEGMATQLGEWWKQQQPANQVDKLFSDIKGAVDMLPDNAATQPLKKLAAEADRLALSSDEEEELMGALIDKVTPDNEAGNSMQEFLTGQYAVGKGIEAGAQIPLTVMAAIEGSDDPWNNPPAFVAQSPVGDAMFEIARAVTPTVLGAAPAGGLGAVSGLGPRLAESALETAGTRDIDDILFGRELATNLGKVANHLGYDGNQLAKELVEGDSINAQILIKVVGFAQNYGINFGADKLVPFFGNKVLDAFNVNAKGPLDATVPAGTPMYHGTSKTGAEGILAEGFKPSKSGLFPKEEGVYFTEHFNYSQAYANSYGDMPVKPGDDVGSVFAGTVPEGVNILDVPASGLSLNDYAQKVGAMKDGNLQIIKWAKEQGYDGIRFQPRFTDKPRKNYSAHEVFLWNTQHANKFASEQWTSSLKQDITEKVGNVDLTQKTADILGTSREGVEKAMADAKTPAYTALNEPHQVMDVDSVVPVSKPSKGQQVISDEALIREALRKNGLADDGLSAADRSYFTNWSAVADEASTQRALKEASKTLRRLREFPGDLKDAMLRAEKWWFANKDLIDADLEKFTESFAKNFLSTRSKYKELNTASFKDLETFMKEFSETTEEGFLVSALIGEELGIRLQKTARMASNLDALPTPIDFTEAVENFITYHEKVQQFLIPLRRGKRRWAVEGQLQQRKNIKAIKDADVQGSIKKQNPVSSDDPSRAFSTVKADPADPGKTVRELWESYKAGDDAAGKTLKQYMYLVSYGDPRQGVSQVENLSTALRDQLRKGNTDAVSNLYYAFMLSDLTTQVASGASNVSRLVAEPLGAILSGEKAYGVGQLVGGWNNLGNGMRVFRQSLMDGQAVNSGAKVENIIEDLKLKQLQLENRYEGLTKQMNQDGASMGDKFGAWVDFQLQSMSLSPAVAVFGRALQSADEASKAIFGSQVAYGRAFKEAAEMGLANDPKTVERLINNHMNVVFRDGVSTGKITDLDVLDGAKALTFQTGIPVNGNIVDNAFLAAQDAADTSAFWRFVSPFTKVSYNVLEVSARYEPTGFLRQFVPRYKAILNGEMGDVAQMQLKSQIAFGRTWTAGLAVTAWMGGATGFNPPPGMPRQSFIIPAPGTAKGWIAIPYGKLEPFATLTSVVVDSVQALRDDVITAGQYDKAIQEILFSIGMATFNKTFQSGMTDMAALFDAKNFGEGTIKSIANLSGAVVPRANNMVFSWFNPYQTITTDQNNVFQTFWNSFRSRNFGGAGNPVLFDELTGEPVPKVATLGPSDNYWSAVMGSVFNEVVYPGNVRNAPVDPVRDMLGKLNYKLTPMSSLKVVEGVALSPDQQSILSKDMHDVGKLRTKLKNYFESQQFKRTYKTFQALRFTDSPIGSTNEGTRAHELLKDIHTDINNIRAQAKRLAVSEGRLGNDKDFMRRYLKAKHVFSPQASAQPQIDPDLQALLSIPV